MSTGRIVLLVIVVGTALRLALAAVAGLGYDESYMLGNARQFMLSYVDQVPMHLWMAGLARVVFHSEASIFVRMPFILMFAGSVWLMYRLTRRLFGERAGLWAVIAFNLAPVFSVSHSSWILADGPVIFFLLATANVLARILFEEVPAYRLTRWWIWAGVLGGLAILSKYHAILFILGAFVTLLTLPQGRRHLATPGPWLAAVAAVVVFSPVIIWNVDNHFVGFFFQQKRVEAPALGWQNLAESLLGQIAYLTPWLIVPFALALFGAFRRGTSDPKSWFMAMSASGPIFVFTAVMLFAHGFPHWQMPGWLFTIPLFGRDAALLAERRPKFARSYMAVAAVLFAAVIGALVVQLKTGELVPQGVVDDNPRIDPTLALIDWTPLKAALAARGMLGPDTVAASPLWMTAGKTSYALGPDVPVVCVCDDPQHFPYRYDQSQWNGRDVIVVVPKGEEWMWDVAARFFDSLQPLDPVVIMRGSRPAVTLELRLGKNLHYPGK